MKKYLVLFLFCSCIANATIENNVIENQQALKDNQNPNITTNIENKISTTTTMLKESENTQLNQTQLGNTQTNIQTQSIQSIQTSQNTNQQYQLSTHILDISKGQPAPNVRISLYKTVSNQWVKISDGITDDNGRIKNFLPMNIDNSGTYKLSFFVKEYFENQGLKSIYPYVDVVFDIEGNGHYHIPITISANGYSTYRGN